MAAARARLRAKREAEGRIIGEFLEGALHGLFVVFVVVLILGAAFCLSGCGFAPSKHLATAPVRTETVEVPKYTTQPVAPELTAPIVVDKPAPACNDGQSAVYCNGQVAALLVEFRHALDTCNADRKAIRDGQSGN